ncbi:UDP-3-O-(3-hydroxymyristoyl)glucosamine N-acyltransferase [Roseomonas elaeocarpi]|uniref:UDP-3-O-acylglucosamine N-acyltransferase n=1 Tax=Roseomonas elaeocarpi TaxID=907779 RepID=A0ABV6JR38_9PROT
MTDARFHPAAGEFDLAAIAASAGAELVSGDPSRRLRGVAPLNTADGGELAFAEGRRNLEALRATAAGAVVVAADQVAEVPEGVAVLRARSPQLAFARAAALFHPPQAPRPGIHPTAVIGEGCRIGEGCEIGPYAVIGRDVTLGARCILGPHVTVGDGCVFGDDCHLQAHASVAFCLAGNEVVLHPGARVGNEGFGFVPDEQGRFVTVPQLGRVILEDRVQVGANSCVDRGAAGDTVLGAGTRLDNLVMLGHNVRTGRGCIVVAQAGISGSTVLGDYVTVAAQAGLTGHLRIGTKARIGAQSGVMNDVPAGTDVLGSPSQPVRDAMRGYATLRKLAARKDVTDRTG